MALPYEPNVSYNVDENLVHYRPYVRAVAAEVHPVPDESSNGHRLELAVIENIIIPNRTERLANAEQRRSDDPDHRQEPNYQLFPASSSVDSCTTTDSVQRNPNIPHNDDDLLCRTHMQAENTCCHKLTQRVSNICSRIWQAIRNNRWISLAYLALTVVTCLLIISLYIMRKPPKPQQPNYFTPSEFLSGVIDDLTVTTAKWHNDSLLYHDRRHNTLSLINYTSGGIRDLLKGSSSLNASHRLQLSADGRFVALHIGEPHPPKKTKLFDNRHEYDQLKIRCEVFDLQTTNMIPTPCTVPYIIQYQEFGPLNHQMVYVLDNNVHYKMHIDDYSAGLTTSGSKNHTAVPYVVNGLMPPAYRLDMNGVRDHALWFSPKGDYLAVGEFLDYRNDSNPDAAARVNESLPIPRLHFFRLNTVSQAKGSFLVQTPRQLLATGVEPVLLTVGWSEASENGSRKRGDISRTPLRIVSMWTDRWQLTTYVSICDVNATCQEADELPAYQNPIQPLLFDDQNYRELIFLTSIHVGDGIQSVIAAYPTEHQHTLLNYGYNDYRFLSEPIPKRNVLRLLHWDSTHSILFYLAIEQNSPRQMQLYSLFSDANGNSTGQCLTCHMTPRYDHFDAVFANSANLFLLLKQGPAAPQSAVFKWWFVLAEEIDVLRNGLDGVNEVQRRLGGKPVVISVNESFSVQLTYPPRYHRFDDTEYRYPALVVTSPNGPGTFNGTSEWRMQWPELLGTERRYVVIRIDASGNSRNGQWMRTRDGIANMGKAEADDMLRALEFVRSGFNIDNDRIGIWGEQYGGFVAGLALARDVKKRIRCVAVVEPVTDLRHHRALITERYMGNLTKNEPAYEAANLEQMTVPDRKLLLVHGQHSQARAMSQRWAAQLEEKDVRFEQIVRSIDRAKELEKVSQYFDRCFREACHAVDMA